MNRILYVIALIFVAATAVYSQSTVLTGGNNFSVGLCDNHKVYAWGSNGSGQAGQQSLTTTSYTVPTAVNFTGTLGATRNFVQVNAGSGAHALALDCSGHVWVWGENVCGQVGNGVAVNQTNCFAGGPSVPVSTPNEVLKGGQSAGTGENATYLHSIKLIGGGNNFSIAVDSTGYVWTWGEDQYGELGDGTPGNTSNVPVQVVKCASAGGGFLNNIVFVQGGDQSAYALDASGQVWAWGLNDNNNLANGTSGTAGNSSCANYVYKGPSTVGSGSATSTAASLGLTKLTGIKQIAAGDTHGMALDSSGQVWTWGGDWAPGQLGQGINYIPNAFASRVVAPMNFTYSTNGYASPYGGCTGCTYITGAKFIAAGQASSAIVLSDGSVVTFGGEGLYPGSACGTGQLLFSGTLGNGLPATAATCQSNTTRCTAYTTAPTSSPAGCAGYGTPTYVETSAGTKLTNIVSIARGDAWYFATDNTGKTYTWGFNGGGTTGTPTVPAVLSSTGNYGGELGVGNTIDQAYATAVTLPTGCTGVATPCPDKPGLGGDFSICPGVSFALTAAESQLGYTYTWYNYVGTTLSGSTATWNQLTSGVDKSSVTESIASITFFIVAVSYAGGPCGACTTQYDTIKVSPITPSWTTNGTYCTSGTDITHVQFEAYDPAKKAVFKWYTAESGGTAITGSDFGTNGGDTIKILKTAAITTYAPGCPYALYVDDEATYTGALESSTTGCSTTSNIFNGSITGTNSAVLEVYISQANVTLTSLDFWLNNGGSSSTANYTFSVYKDGTGTYNCGSCSGGPYSGASGTALYTSPATPITQAATGWISNTITGSYTFTAAGYYWISLNQSVSSGNPQVGLITCPAAGPSYTSGSGLWTSPWTDNTGYNIMKGVSAAYQSSFKYNGPFYNLQFTYTSPYSCKRTLVCATLGTCPAPVKFLSFVAEQQYSSVALNWSTGTEENSSYFDVQRSTDGQNFSSIGKVSAAGNSTIIRNYTFQDNGAAELNGVIYYRIVEYDINGQTTTSTLQAVNTGKGKDVEVVPNPNNGSFMVIIEGESEVLNLVLYNSVGIAVYTSTGKAEGNTFSQNINIQNLPAGVYYLNIQTPTNNWVKKVVKEE